METINGKFGLILLKLLENAKNENEQKLKKIKESDNLNLSSLQEKLHDIKNINKTDLQNFIDRIKANKLAFSKKIDFLNEEIIKRNVIIKEEEKKLKKLIEENAIKEKEEELKCKIMEKRIEKFKHNINTNMIKITNLEKLGDDDKINELNQEIATLKQEIATLKQEIAPLKQEMAPLKQEIKKLKDEIEELKGGNSVFFDKVQKLSEKIHNQNIIITKAKKVENDFNLINIQLENEKEKLKKDLQELENEFKELEVLNKRLFTENTEITERIEVITQEKTILESEFQKKNEELRLEKEEKQIIANIEKKNEELEKEINALKIRLTEKSTELEESTKCFIDVNEVRRLNKIIRAIMAEEEIKIPERSKYIESLEEFTKNQMDAIINDSGEFSEYLRNIKIPEGEEDIVGPLFEGMKKIANEKSMEEEVKD